MLKTKSALFVVAWLFNVQVSSGQSKVAQGSSTGHDAMGRPILTEAQVRLHKVENEERSKLNAVIQKLLRQARAFVEAGEIPNAIPIYDRVTLLYRSSDSLVMVSTITAESLSFQRKTKIAAGILRESHKRNPGSWNNDFLWITYYDIQDGLLNDASECLKSRLEATYSKERGFPVDLKWTPQSMQATSMLLLAEEAMSVKMPKVAVSRLLIADGLAPNNHRICSLLGSLYHALNDFKQAVNWRSKALACAKTDHDKWADKWALGESQLKQRSQHPER